jgi:hypothetical protein
MAFTEDLSPFFDTDDFAVSAVIKTAAGATVRTINVILTSALAALQLLGAEALTSEPSVLCKTSDLSGVVVNDYKLTVGAVTYRITDRKDDGTGVSTLQIRI